MLAKTKADYYSNKKYKVHLLDEFYGMSEHKDSLITEFKRDLSHGFTLYTKRNLVRFLQCADDIPDIAEQFVLLHEYDCTHNKYSNTEERYVLTYGDIVGSQKWQDKRDRVCGSKNPAWKHGGKLSSWCKDSVYYSEESRKKAAANRSYTNRLDYYLDKGYGVSEAEHLLKERQATGRLSKFIARYGEVDGKKRWELRQIKWQNTLNAKSKEEIADINKRKSSGIGKFLDRNIPGELYYIRFYSEHRQFWKIGITSRSLSERFNFNSLYMKHGIKYDIKFINCYDTIQQAYDEEQYILRHFNDKRLTIDLKGFYTTEAFEYDVLEGFYE